MKRILLKILGPSRCLKYKHIFRLFVGKRILGNWEVFHSQMGEDIILRNLMQNKSNGFFVDIGAYHPIDLSNTFYFYKKGWRGINVDATPDSMEKFKLLRPNDINLEIGVADKECEMDYYLFANRAFNTFFEPDLKYVKEGFNLEPYKIVKTRFMPLYKILETHMPASVSQIDFLSIDVEGADELVLRSNDFNKYKPKVICIEKHINYKEFSESQLCYFLKNLNYEFAAKTGPSYFFYLND